MTAHRQSKLRCTKNAPAAFGDEAAFHYSALPIITTNLEVTTDSRQANAVKLGPRQSGEIWTINILHHIENKTE